MYGSARGESGGPSGGGQMQPGVVQRRPLDDGQQVAAATGRGGGVDDGTAGLIAERRRKDRRGRHRCGRRDVEGEQALLQAPQILHARDDFLAGIAALAKIDAADQVPVGGLGDEPILRRAGDQRHAGGDGEPVPMVGGHRLRPGGQLRAHGGRDGHRRMYDIASVGSGDHQAFRDGDALRGFRRCTEGGGDRGAGAGAGHPEALARCRDVGDDHLRAQHEHRQPLGQRFGQIVGDQRRECIGRSAP